MIYFVLSYSNVIVHLIPKLHFYVWHSNIKGRKQRHHQGITKGEKFYQFNLTISSVNRVESAHLRSVKFLGLNKKIYLFHCYRGDGNLDPRTVRVFPNKEDIARIKEWDQYVISMELSEYHPQLKRFKKLVRYTEMFFVISSQYSVSFKYKMFRMFRIFINDYWIDNFV